MIGLLFSILTGKGITLLEEPEISLHPGVVARLPEFIAKMQRYKNRQVVITTHSYDILSNEGIDEGEVIVLRGGAEGTKAEVIADIQEAKDVLDAGLSMADAVLPMSCPENVRDISNVSVDGV